MITRRGRHTWLGSVACLVAVSMVGCNNSTSSCSRDPDYVTVSKAEGIVEGNTYHSAPFGGPYQYFPASRTVSFEHGLGTIPYSIQFWLAFSENGTLAPSAGNMTELRPLDYPDAPAADAVTDQQISVYNNTCSEFWLWVVATAPTPTPTP